MLPYKIHKGNTYNKNIGEVTVGNHTCIELYWIVECKWIYFICLKNIKPIVEDSLTSIGISEMVNT